MVDLIPMQFLPPGRSGWIRQLIGMPADVHRLEELGLRSGRMVEMVQPGSPCIVRFSGSKLCFRDTEALGVLVQMGDEE